MVAVPLIERVSCTQRECLHNGNDPPGGNLILLEGYANVFHRDYRDGFDFNGGIKNSSAAENSDIVEYSVGFGLNLPLMPWLFSSRWPDWISCHPNHPSSRHFHCSRCNVCTGSEVSSAIHIKPVWRRWHLQEQRRLYSWYKRRWFSHLTESNHAKFLWSLIEKKNVARQLFFCKPS